MLNFCDKDISGIQVDQFIKPIENNIRPTNSLSKRNNISDFSNYF